MSEIERYWVCLGCGLEIHGMPKFAEPMSCEKCNGSDFRKMNRKTISIKNWTRGSFE